MPTAMTVETRFRNFAIWHGREAREKRCIDNGAMSHTISASLWAYMGG